MFVKRVLFLIESFFFYQTKKFRLTMGFGHGDMAYPSKQARMSVNNNAFSYRGGFGGLDGLDGFSASPNSHYWRGPPAAAVG